jgi:hypothetical protein
MMLLSVLLSGTAHADDNPAGLPTPEPYVLVHAWATAWDTDEDPTADPAGYGDPEDDIGFKVRRARIGMTGKNDVWSYSVIVGTSAPYDALRTSTEGDIDIVDANLGYQVADGLWVTGGVQKVPISREQIMSSQRLSLGERAAASEWLVPGRDAGVLAEYRGGSGSMETRFSLGAYNGNGSLETDDNAGKLFAGRAEMIFGDANPYRTFGKRDDTTFAFAVDGWRNDEAATDTTGFGADLMLRASGLSIMAEGRMAIVGPDNTDVEQPGVLSETRRIGGLAQASYTINRVEPAVRFSLYDDDMDAEDNGDVADVMAGVTWNSKGANMRVGGGYVYRMELGGVTVSNDTVRLWWMMSI